MSIEVHVETRGDLRPDPAVDTMQAIFYSIFNDIPSDKGERHLSGAIIVDVMSARAAQKPVSPKPRAVSPKPRSVSPKPRSRSPKPSSRSPKPRAASPQLFTSKASHVRGGGASKGEPCPGTSKESDEAERHGSGSDTPGDQQKRRESILTKSGVEDDNVEYVTNEAELIDSFLKLVRK